MKQPKKSVRRRRNPRAHNPVCKVTVQLPAIEIDVTEFIELSRAAAVIKKGIENFDPSQILKVKP